MQGRRREGGGGGEGEGEKMERGGGYEGGGRSPSWSRLLLEEDSLLDIIEGPSIRLQWRS